MTPTLVIAEAGSDHQWDVARACRLIDVAAFAGADVVKFQWCSAPVALAARRGMEDAHTYDRLAFPSAWHERLAERCRVRRVGYACTVYLREDLEAVSPYVVLFKVASFEALDRPFLFAHLPHLKGRPLIVSTGMLSADEVWGLRETVSFPAPRLLHCVSAYPTPPDEVNLAVLTQDGDYDGFSDHTGHRLTGALAVVLGAEIIEVHFRLDTTSTENPAANPDYPHSHAPSSLTEYIANLRLAERMRGDGIKRCQPSEEPMLRHRAKERA